MNTQLIFATNNNNKVIEIKNVLNNSMQIMSLKGSGIDVEIPEPFDSLEENAAEKSRVIYEMTNKNCFSEDTGLEVEALNGAPGVRSARYAGENSNGEENILLLLKNLSGISHRVAQFKTVISLRLEGEEFQFIGTCRGKIIEQPIGENGFGYDAIFIPDGSEKSFAQMDMNEKNIFSHRKKATQLLVAFLNKKDV